MFSGAIFTEASKVLAILIIFILVSEIVLTLTLALLNIPVSVMILPFFAIPLLFTHFFVVLGCWVQEIEKKASDFLRRLSGMLQ